MVHGVNEVLTRDYAKRLFIGIDKEGTPDLVTVDGEKDGLPCVRRSHSIEVRADSICSGATSRTNACLRYLFQLRDEDTFSLGCNNDDDESKSASMFFIVIHGAEDLSATACAMLRKLMETRCETLRIIMTCRDPSSLLPAVRSRMVDVAVPELADLIDETLSDTLTSLWKQSKTFEDARNVWYSIIAPFLSSQEACRLLLLTGAKISILMTASRHASLSPLSATSNLYLEPAILSAWSCVQKGGVVST